MHPGRLHGCFGIRRSAVVQGSRGVTGIVSPAVLRPDQQAWQAMSQTQSSTAIFDTGHGLRTRWARPSLLMRISSMSASVMPKLLHGQCQIV